MSLPRWNRIRHVLIVSTLVLSSLSARADDERAFWDVWKLHSSTTNRHAEVLAACEGFATAAPADPLLPVTRHIAAWRLLKLGRHDEAAAILTPMVRDGAEGMQKVASDIARAWLTRLDRETLKDALQKVYLREVAFPDRLDVWANDTTNAPPLTDRWGKTWQYGLVGFKHIPGLRNQKYALRSRILLRHSDLAAALDVPYADRIRLKPVRLKTLDSGKALIEFDPGDDTGPALLTVGARHGLVALAYVGEHILLLGDGDHWKALSKPRR